MINDMTTYYTWLPMGITGVSVKGVVRMTRHDWIRQQLHQAFSKVHDNLIEELAEELSALDYLRYQFLKHGECYTLPDGRCLGIRCIHDASPDDVSYMSEG